MSRLLVVAFWSLCPVDATSNRGFTDCPCIDPGWEHFSFTNASHCPDPERPLAALINGAVHCYPTSYGSGSCSAWDSQEKPVCVNSDGTPVSNRPTFCEDRWCYVSGSTCRLAKARSAYFPGLLDLWYSYATCGSFDSFSGRTIEQYLKGQTLRVHALNEPPMVFRDDSSTDLKGVVADLYSRIYRDVQLNVVEKELLPYNGSAWDACVRDVAFGALDLCLGTFWELPRRRALVSFVTPIMVDIMYLVVAKKSVEPDMFSIIFGVFEPFTLRLWVCIAAAIFVISLALYVLERNSHPDDHDDFPHDHALQNVAESYYKGCLGFWSGGVAHQPMTIGGKIVLVAFGLFIVLTLAGYTANLASFLVVKRESESSFNNIDELLAAGGKVCMWGSLEGFFLEQYSTAASQVVPVSDTEEAFSKLDAGECDGIMNGERENDAWLKKTAHCDKVEVSAVFSLMLSQPVSSEFARGLSYLAVKNKPLLPGIMSQYGSIDECASESATEDDDAHSDGQMDITDFIGTFLITGAASALGFVIALLKVLCHRAHKQVKKNISKPSIVGGESQPDDPGDLTNEDPAGLSGDQVARDLRADFEKVRQEMSQLAKAQKEFLENCDVVKRAAI